MMDDEGLWWTGRSQSPKGAAFALPRIRKWSKGPVMCAGILSLVSWHPQRTVGVRRGVEAIFRVLLLDQADWWPVDCCKVPKKKTIVGATKRTRWILTWSKCRFTTCCVPLFSSHFPTSSNSSSPWDQCRERKRICRVCDITAGARYKLRAIRSMFQM